MACGATKFSNDESRIEEAQTKGLSGSAIPALMVEGDNRPGLGHAIAQSMAEAGIKLTFSRSAGRREEVLGSDPDLRRKTIRRKPPLE